MITGAQARTLRIIGASLASKGASPTIRELMESMGTKSKGGVHRLVACLQQRGFLTYIPRAARSIVLTELGANWLKSFSEPRKCPHCGGQIEIGAGVG